MPDTMWWNGTKVILSKYIIESKKVRMRNHKAKRIDKKYLKKYGFKIIQVPGKIFYMKHENSLYMHPKTFEKVKKSMEVQNG